MESQVELIKKLHRSAGFEAERSYPSLFQLLGYRKHIAQQLLTEGDDERHKNLNDSYDYINEQIKQLLGL